MSKQEKNLRNALKANAWFSLLTSLNLVFFSAPIARVMGINNAMILTYVGIGLLLFMVSLFYIAFKDQIRAKEVKMIIYQDWAWVIGSAFLLLFNPFSVSSIGLEIIFIVALMVMLLAILQARALRGLRQS